MQFIPAPVPPYMETARAISDANGTDTGTETLVQQHFKDEQDINVILKRFGMTAQMPSGISGGMYGDFTDVEDYQDALARIKRAQDGFMTLPPEVREKFDNDPGKLIARAQSVDLETLQNEVFPPKEPPAPPPA